MYKKIILSLFLITALLINISNYANAANMSERFSAFSATWHDVNLKGGVLDADIDCLYGTGNLNHNLTPTFKFGTNESILKTSNWAMTATIYAQGGVPVNAMYGPDTDPSIILANTRIDGLNDYRPTIGAINNIKDGSLNDNPNAIAYPITLSFNAWLPGRLIIESYGYNDGLDRFDVVSRGRHKREVTLNVLSSARVGSFNSTDTFGPYQAEVTFAYIPAP